ncbi:MAG TPA: succinylglutamate desuccinylase/aspartoacylase family protein [Acetobacteraceae bacterium]|nr:succinylglutamate desuccinylase/aspartoacylase family protein [Acetobacteraceae bacterium]
MPVDFATLVVPRFDVRLAPPDLRPWHEGNTGVPGFTTCTASRPGPHVAVLALSHGNEIAGAVALDRLLRGGFRPVQGRLTFGFVNLAAFARFSPEQPTLSRFVDEDINRVWDPAVLDGPRRSNEIARAREIRPLIDTVDVLLDLHSMLWTSDPLMLSGGTEKGIRLARHIGVPELIVADHGHAGGQRLIDYPRFSDPDTPFAANLVEAGLHWEPETVETALATIAGLLRHCGMAPEETALLPPRPRRTRPRIAQVTQTVTAMTGKFSFVQPWRGGDVIPRRNTLIALDGGTEIRTPHDECLLVMPSLRPSRGHTAVRLARFL